MAENTALKKYYKEKFNFDVDALSDEQKRLMTAAVAAIERAQAAPSIWSPDKGWQANPDFERLQKGGIPRSVAQKLSLWRHYQGGIGPEALDSERLRRFKIPDDQIKKAEAERENDFIGRAPAAYQMWERDEEVKPAAMQMPAEEITAPSPAPASQPVRNAMPSQPAPETPSVVPQPEPTGPGNVWNMQQQLPDGSWVPMKYRGM